MSAGKLFSKWHVLLVDNEPDNLDVAVKVLNFYGVRTSCAENGKEGLAILARVKPTTVLLDLSMPKMTGWELLHLIRQDMKIADLPVIALTAHAMNGDRDRAIAAGFDGYITKPFNPLTLISEIQQILSECGKLPQGTEMAEEIKTGPLPAERVNP